MFIKWRIQPKIRNGKPSGKFIAQIIIVSSYRLTKKNYFEASKKLGYDLKTSIQIWRKTKNTSAVKNPKHKVIYRFPSFPTCLYEHFGEPHWDKER